MRNLKEDLEICEKATPGPWRWLEDVWNGGYKGIIGPDDEEVLFPDHRNDGDDGDAWFEEFPSDEDRIFLTAAREGWPHAIQRAIAAESELAIANAALEKLRQENERYKQVLIDIADAPDKTWKPMQVFRSNEQVAVDDAINEGVTNMADIAREALGLPAWGTLDQIKQGLAGEALGGTSND